MQLFLGENGILSKSTTAKEETIKQTATEIMNLKITHLQIQSYAENAKAISLQQLADNLCKDKDMEYVLNTSQKQASLETEFLPLIKVEDGKSIYTKLKEYPYEFEINSFLKIVSVDGFELSSSGNEVNKNEYDKLQENYNQLLEKLKELEKSNNELLESSKELEKNYTQSISSALNEIDIETEENETLLSLTEKIKNIKAKQKITKMNINGIGYNYSNVYYFDITSYENYKNLTIENLSVQLQRTPFRATQQSDACGVLNYSFSYTPENGQITVTLGGSMSHQSWGDPAPNATITIIE